MSSHHIWKINFRVPLLPPHFRTIWDYKNVDVSSNQHAIKNFKWQYAFESKMNMMKWMNPKTSSSLGKRAKLTKSYLKSPSDSLTELLMSKSSNLIAAAKEKDG